MTWTEERLRLLLELWPTGATTAEIACRLGLGREGKNKVIGKAHRLGLDPRPSPIIRAGSPRIVGPVGRPPAPRVTLPALPMPLVIPMPVVRPRPTPPKPVIKAPPPRAPAPPREPVQRGQCL